jgi:hypothetical protein
MSGNDLAFGKGDRFGLFVLCILPFVLAVVLSSEVLARISLLSPGLAVLANPKSTHVNEFLAVACAHFSVVPLLFLAWRDQWLRLLREVSPLPEPAATDY